MATVQYRICDRCGLKIKEHSYKLAKISKPKIRWIICGAVLEEHKELCGECSEALEDFLKPLKGVNQ